MNRRIVLIDTEETPNYVSYCGCGFGDEIYTIQHLSELPESELKQIINVGVGDGLLLVGSSPFSYLQKFYHFGIRSENYFDCSKLRRLSIEGGAFVKVIVDFPDQDVINDFMSEDFAKPVDFSWFKHKILHTFNEAVRFLDWLDSLPEDTNYGFDYEASGMPLDEWFEISGASICTTKYGGFISFTDIRHTSSEAEYKQLLQRLGQFLEKRQEHIWTYNMQYEFQVSHRMLGVDLYNLCDASVVNVLDGNHLKKYSLKWTANMVLQSTVWDTDFDYISDLIDSMLFDVVGKLKKDKQKVLKVTPENFKSTEEWATLCSKYPGYADEFEKLILEYWGNPFMCIPSDILGFYCNLDAFYTLMIYEARKNTYTKQAFDVFMDNIRLQSRLHSCGINKDEQFRHEYEVYCKKMMVWGITYCAEARCKIKMEKHQKLMANIKKYSPVAVKLLKESKFFNGDTLEITKYILSSNIDTMDASDTGLDEGRLLMKFGADFAEKFLDVVKNAMVEVKMKTKIDEGIVRKKKILGIIAEKLGELIELDKIKLGKKHEELEKFIYYETAYNELMKVSKRQLNDIDKIPDTIVAFGQTFDLDDYADFISNNYFKCKSPIENDEICLEFSQLFPHETSYLAAILESTLQLNNGDKYYSSIGIDNINDAFKHFMDNWMAYFNSCSSARDYMISHPELYKYVPAKNNTEEGFIVVNENFVDVNLPEVIMGDYPEKPYKLAYQFYTDITEKEELPDSVKEIWANFNGYKAQEQFFKSVSDDDSIQFYNKIFEESDLNENFKFMRKFTIHYLLYKKYSKVLTTYIGTYDKKKEKNVGMFLGDDKWVIENPQNHVMIRDANPDEPGAVCKMTTRFAALEKSSKRWSSGYHTIISHSDIKSTIASYPGCLVTYFDISSAEVKSAGFQSGDPSLIDKFVNGIDIYIHTAKLLLGEEGWNKLSDKDKKDWRKKFKTVFLGVLYGLGRKSLAERLNTSEDEADHIIQSLYNSYPKLREYVADQQKYPLEHDGCIRTFFGDRLQVDEWKYYKKATNQKEKKNLEARISRLGVNLPIQGGTSTAMSSGFYNDLRVAINEGWNLTSFITVHDSNTCNLPADKVWEIRQFYDKNFTDFCYEMTGIKLLFDLECGSNYNDTCSLKSISDDVVEFKGNALSILQIMDRMNECPGLVYEISIPREEIIPNYVENPISRFIDEKGCSYRKDLSKYTVQFKKLS